MNTLLSYIAGVLVIFLSLIEYIIIIEIVLSWLILVGVRIRIGFFRAITTPIYVAIRRYIPTTIWPLDLTPMIVLIIIQLLMNLLIPFVPMF